MFSMYMITCICLETFCISEDILKPLMLNLDFTDTVNAIGFSYRLKTVHQFFKSLVFFMFKTSFRHC